MLFEFLYCFITHCGPLLTKQHLISSTLKITTTANLYLTPSCLAHPHQGCVKTISCFYQASFPLYYFNGEEIIHIHVHDNVNNRLPKILQKITIIILFTVDLCKVRIFKKSTLFPTSFQLFCDLLSQKIEDRIDEKIHRTTPLKALLKGIPNRVANCLLGMACPVPPHHRLPVASSA